MNITDTRVDWSKVKSVTFKENQIPWDKGSRGGNIGVPVGVPYQCGFHPFVTGQMHLTPLLDDPLGSFWIRTAHLFVPLPAE